VSRQQKAVLFFGTNGTGKTTKMLLGAASFLKSNPHKRILALLPDDGERKFDIFREVRPNINDLREFEGLGKIYCEDRKVLKLIYKTYTERDKPPFSGLMIFDDPGVILNRRPEEALLLLRRRRQMNADMFWNFHGLHTDMPRAFFTYTTDIVLHRTQDDHHDTLNKLPENKQAAFEQMYRRVQKISEQDKYYAEQLRLG
jgi:hypothetical protein